MEKKVSWWLDLLVTILFSLYVLLIAAFVISFLANRSLWPAVAVLANIFLMFPARLVLMEFASYKQKEHPVLLWVLAYCWLPLLVSYWLVRLVALFPCEEARVLVGNR